MQELKEKVSLPNSEIMIHQPLGGARGQASDIKIHTEHILRTKDKLNNILSERTGQPLETIMKIQTRLFHVSRGSKKYGLIDKVMVKK